MRGLAAAGLAAALLVASCATAPRSPAPGDDLGGAIWEVPPGSLGTQRLYRIEYDGPEGGGSFRLTLRLVREDRYQLQAVDPVGRALWSLDVEGDSGLWLDHRAEAACVLEGSLDLAASHLTPFPLTALPALLLGRLPARPPQASRGEVPSGGGSAGEDGPADRSLDFVDREGRRWSAVVEGGLLDSWSLTEPGATAPGVSWQRRGPESLLSDRDRGVQLTWRQRVVERLSAPLAQLTVPSSYAIVPCSVWRQAPPDVGHVPGPVRGDGRGGRAARR